MNDHLPESLMILSRSSSSTSFFCSIFFFSFLHFSMVGVPKKTSCTVLYMNWNNTNIHHHQVLEKLTQIIGGGTKIPSNLDLLSYNPNFQQHMETQVLYATLDTTISTVLSIISNKQTFHPGFHMQLEVFRESCGQLYVGHDQLLLVKKNREKVQVEHLSPLSP